MLLRLADGRSFLKLTIVSFRLLVLIGCFGRLCLPAFSQSNWYSEILRNSLVEPSEFHSGGVAKDAIPALSRPRFVLGGVGQHFFSSLEPVIVFEYGGIARAYPLGLMMWHEIINDEVAGLPILITYCPLCNASVVYERRVSGRIFDFGVSGLLRNSDLVMYDRQTQSFWQQFTGQCLSGGQVGAQLKNLPSKVVAVGKFVQEFPKGEILSPETGYNYNYDANPYHRYDSKNEKPFLFKGALDEKLPPLERVLGVTRGTLAKAYPYSELEKRFVINDELADCPIVVFCQGSTLSVLDQPIISKSRQVAAPEAFSARLMGKVLTFDYRDGKNYDRESGSIWNSSGRCLKGFYVGNRLEAVSTVPCFAFSWFAFYPQSGIWYGQRK